MTPIVWLLCIVVLSQITGCASLTTSTGNANDRIDAWLHQREYGKALAFVADLKESPSPAAGNLQALQAKIDAHIAAYEQQILAGAENAAAANDWGAGFDLYRDALSRVPESRRLQQGQQQLRQRHAEHLDRLELERLIARGEWTLKDLEVSKLAEANDAHGWWGQMWLQRKVAGAHEVALELAEHGKRALERKELALAGRLLPLAMNLSTTGEIVALNRQLQEALEEGPARRHIEPQGNGAAPAAARTRGMHGDQAARLRIEPQGVGEPQPAATGMGAGSQDDKERSAIKSQERKKTKRLMADFRKACQEKNFVEARELRSQLEERGFDSRELEKLSKQLASDIARHVKHLTEIGAVHYSQQQYDEALNVWRQAHVLDPENERLTARIKRVTRVLEKLQRLRNKSSATQ